MSAALTQLQQQKAEFIKAYNAGNIQQGSYSSKEAAYQAAIAKQNQLIAQEQAKLNQQSAASSGSYSRQEIQNKIAAAKPAPTSFQVNQPSGYYNRQDVIQKTKQASNIPITNSQDIHTYNRQEAIYNSTISRTELKSNLLSQKIASQNPELLKQVPQGALITSYDPNTQKATYMSPSEVTSFKESVNFYNKAGYGQFGGQYNIPTDIKPEQIASIKEVPNVTFIPGTNIPQSVSGKSLEFTLKPQEDKSLKNSTFTFSNINIEGAFGVKPVIRTNEQRVLALEVLGATVVAPFIGPAAVAKGAAVGFGFSQVMKTGGAYYNEGKWNGDISKSLLTPQEAIEGAATGVIFAGVGEATLAGLSKISTTGAKIAGFKFNPLTGAKEYIPATSTKQAIGAAFGRVGAQTVSGVPTGATLEYVATGQVTPEGIGQNALLGGVFAGAGEVGGRVMPHMPAKIVDTLHIGGVKAKTLVIQETIMKSSIPVKIKPDLIVDVPVEGKPLSDAEIMAQNNIAHGGDFVTSREKIVTVTTLEVKNKRVPLSDAKVFQNIEASNIGKFIDVAGEQKTISVQKPTFETGVGIDASGKIVSGNTKPVDVKFISPEAGEVTTYGIVNAPSGIKTGVVSESRLGSKPNLIDMTEKLSSGKLKSVKDNFLDTTESTGDITGIANRTISQNEAPYTEPPKFEIFNPKGNLSYEQKTKVKLNIEGATDKTTLGELLGRSDPLNTKAGDRVSEVTSWVASDNIKALRKAAKTAPEGAQFSETRPANPYLAIVEGTDIAYVKEQFKDGTRHISKIQSGDVNVGKAIQEFKFEQGMEIKGAKFKEFDVELPKVKESSKPALVTKETYINTSGKQNNAELILRNNVKFQLRAKIPATQDIGLLLNKTSLSRTDRLLNNLRFSQEKLNSIARHPNNPLSFADNVIKRLNLGPKKVEGLSLFPESFRDKIIGKYKIGKNLSTEVTYTGQGREPTKPVIDPDANFVIGGEGNKFDQKAYEQITKNNVAGEKAFEGQLKKDEAGKIIRDEQGNALYEGYSNGSKSDDYMHSIGANPEATNPTDFVIGLEKTVNKPKSSGYSTVNIPKNIIGLDLPASQAPLNLQGARGSIVNEQKQSNGYTTYTSNSRIESTEVNGISPVQGGSNPFTSFKGRSYYSQRNRGTEEYEYVYNSYPNDGLNHPAKLSSSFVDMQNISGGKSGAANANSLFDSRGGVRSRFIGDARTRFDSNRRSSTDIFTDQTNRQDSIVRIDQTPIIVPILDPIITPIERPIERPPTTPDQTSRFDYGNYKSYNPWLPPGSKFEAFGGGSSGGGKKRGVKSYKFENPLLEGFELLGAKTKRGEDQSIF